VRKRDASNLPFVSFCFVSSSFVSFSFGSDLKLSNAGYGQ
jgi:hypothetical protein